MKRLLILSIFLPLAAYSPQIKVYLDYDPDYDLWTYKTFDWGQKVKIEEGKNPLHYNERSDKRIRAAVQEQMTMTGYQLTELEALNAQFLQKKEGRVICVYRKNDVKI